MLLSSRMILTGAWDLLFYETNHRKERNDGKDTPLTVTEQHTHGIDLHRNTPGIPQGIDAGGGGRPAGFEGQKQHRLHISNPDFC